MKQGLSSAVMALLIMSTACYPLSAQADEGDEARARELYKNGEQLYAEGLYEEAIVAWERAYELSGRPLLIYNIANALERIGRWEEALDRLNQYRALAPGSERSTLERRMLAIERRLEEKRSAEEAESRARPPSTPPDNGFAPEPRRRRARITPAKGVSVALISLGSAGLATSGIFGGLASEARLELEGLCRATGDVFLCPEAAADALRRDTDFSGAAEASLVIGGTTLGAGIVLAILESQGVLQSGPSELVFIPQAGPTMSGFTVRGVFR